VPTNTIIELNYKTEILPLILQEKPVM